MPRSSPRRRESGSRLAPAGDVAGASWRGRISPPAACRARCDQPCSGADDLLARLTRDRGWRSRSTCARSGRTAPACEPGRDQLAATASVAAAPRGACVAHERREDDDVLRVDAPLPRALACALDHKKQDSEGPGEKLPVRCAHGEMPTRSLRRDEGGDNSRHRRRTRIAHRHDRGRRPRARVLASDRSHATEIARRTAAASQQIATTAVARAQLAIGAALESIGRRPRPPVRSTRIAPPQTRRWPQVMTRCSSRRSHDSCSRRRDAPIHASQSSR